MKTANMHLHQHVSTGYYSIIESGQSKRTRKSYRSSRGCNLSCSKAQGTACSPINDLSFTAIKINNINVISDPSINRGALCKAHLLASCCWQAIELAPETFTALYTVQCTYIHSLITHTHTHTRTHTHTHTHTPHNDPGLLFVLGERLRANNRRGGGEGGRRWGN